MASSEDQEQSNFKHFCKICRKGFMGGSALGGHMRAHGIEDESIWSIEDDEDQASDWEDKVEGSDNNKMYALRTNPNRLKSCRICENCGKEFSSWKSFLEHGKCSCEDVDEELPVSSPSPISQNEEEFSEKRICGWSKKKRSFRAKVGSICSISSKGEEDISLAKCLMSLSNARVNPSDAVLEEPYAFANKDEEQRNTVKAFIAPLTRSLAIDKVSGVAKGLFECNTCKKVFTSHQALGGHRASHKKVKGCFATQINQFNDSFVGNDVIIHEDFLPSKSHISMQYDQGPRVPLVGTSRFKVRVHECSICHRVFSSGQALGGHKRCHWLTSNNCPETSPLVKYHNQFQGHNNTNINLPGPHLQPNKPNPLNLNFPAPVGDADTAGTRWDPPNAQSFEVSTEINLKPWVDVESQDNHHLLHQQLTEHENEDEKYNNKKSNNTIHIASMQNVDVDDDAESKAKLAKLSELKDMNDNGSSSSWLQIGIGSITGGGANS